MIAQRILLSNITATTPTTTTATGTTSPSFGSGRTTLEAKHFASGEELTLAEELIRLSRLTMILTFKAVQDIGPADQLLSLLNQELVTEEERQWLLTATPGNCNCCLRLWECVLYEL